MKSIYYGKRGMHLEKVIEHTNDIYRRKGLALVDKIPTPWNVSYNPKKHINRAFPEKKSTVDFIGISQGRGLAFEAKTTKSRTRFELDNIKSHQVDFLLNYKDQGGIAFFIVLFEKLYEFYFLRIEDLNAWWVAMNIGGRKSIPYSWFMVNCSQIKSGHGVTIDYLKQCDTVY